MSQILYNIVNLQRYQSKARMEGFYEINQSKNHCFRHFMCASVGYGMWWPQHPHLENHIQ
jgi:hypothetical protein